MSFDLKTTSEQLDSNKSVNHRYNIIQATRDITNGSFGSAELEYKWNYASNTWIDFKESFFRIDYTLTNSAGVQLRNNDGIAPAMATAECLFDSYRLLLNERPINTVDQNLSQIGVIQKRKEKSGYWLDNTGQTDNYEASFDIRKNKVIVDPRNPDFTNVQQYEALYNGLSSSPVLSAGTTDFNTLWTNNGSSNNSNFSVTTSGLLCNVTAVYKFAVSFKCNAQTTLDASVDITSLPVPPLLTPSVIINLGVGLNDSYCAVGNIGCIAGQTYYPRIIINSGSAVVDDLRVNIWDSQENLITTNVLPGVPSQSLIFRPPSSLWHGEDQDQALIPACGNFTCVLKPFSDFAKRAVQAVANFSPGVNYIFSVQRCDLYLKTIQGPRVSDTTFYLDMYQWDMQKRQATGNTALNSYQFTVSPQTYEAVIAVQDLAAGVDSRFPTTFMTTFNNQERNITTSYIDYDNQIAPPQNDTSAYVSGSTNYLATRYIENYLVSDSDQVVPLFGAGPESFQTYLSRGPFTSVALRRDASSKATNAKVYMQFSTGPNNVNVLLFSKYRTTALVQIKDGQVTDVRVS
jgi:hypothetical protein